MSAVEPDVNLLAPLRALLEEANLTRAGERLGLGQSSMSGMLTRLRETFHDELLVRVGRDYELTPFARTLLPQVQAALPPLERLLAGDLGGAPGDAQRTFTLMMTDYGMLRLRAALAAVLAEAPGCSLAVGSLPERPMESERDLATHDFVLTVPGIGIDGPHLTLLRDEYVCLLDRDHPALRDGALSFEDFVALPQAVARIGRLHLTPADRRLRELGVDRREPRVTTTSFLPLPDIVAGTDLVAVVPRRLAETAGPLTGTVGVPAPFGAVEIVLNLWWHPIHDGDPMHRWFRERLAAAVAGENVPADAA